MHRFSGRTWSLTRGSGRLFPIDGTKSSMPDIAWMQNPRGGLHGHPGHVHRGGQRAQNADADHQDGEDLFDSNGAQRKAQVETQRPSSRRYRTRQSNLTRLAKSQTFVVASNASISFCRRFARRTCGNHTPPSTSTAAPVWIRYSVERAISYASISRPRVSGRKSKVTTNPIAATITGYQRPA